MTKKTYHHHLNWWSWYLKKIIPMKVCIYQKFHLYILQSSILPPDFSTNISLFQPAEWWSSLYLLAAASVFLTKAFWYNTSFSSTRRCNTLIMASRSAMWLSSSRFLKILHSYEQFPANKIWIAKFCKFCMGWKKILGVQYYIKKFVTYQLRLHAKCVGTLRITCSPQACKKPMQSFNYGMERQGLRGDNLLCWKSNSQ